MVRLGWITDVHLDWLEPAATQSFFAWAAAAPADALLVTGDMADGVPTLGLLERLAAEAGKPVYFVLGNHDFYGSSIAQVRQGATALACRNRQLVYLTSSAAVPLSAATALVGHDGWGDARQGDFEHSRVCLGDFMAIDDLAAVYRDGSRLAELLHRLGDETARHFDSVLPAALERFARVVVATHVPPFVAAACHRGGDDNAADWLPYCVCGAAGDALRRAAQARPDRQMLVLCGHTHEPCEVDILPNLRVITGGRHEPGRSPRLFDL